jgi:hypothetical protein
MTIIAGYIPYAMLASFTMFLAKVTRIVIKIFSYSVVNTGIAYLIE